MNPDNVLTEQFHYYLENQAHLVEKYDRRVIVLKDFEVIGVFDDYVSAVEETRKDHELGTFLVQECSTGPTAYTTSFSAYFSLGYS